MIIPCNMKKKFFKSTINRILKDEVLVLSKEKAQKEIKEFQIFNFINKIVSGKKVSIEETEAFVHNLIENNPSIDISKYPLPNIKFQKTPEGLTAYCLGNDIVVSFDAIFAITNARNRAERLSAMCALICSVGHEYTHFLQDQMQGRYSGAILSENAIFSGSTRVNNKVFNYINNFTDTPIKFDRETKLNLAFYLYSRYPHEFDARKGGMIFTIHTLQQMQGYYMAQNCTDKIKDIELLTKFEYYDFMQNEIDDTNVQPLIDYTLLGTYEKLDINKITNIGRSIENAYLHLVPKNAKQLKENFLPLFSEKEIERHLLKKPLKEYKGKKLHEINYKKYLTELENQVELYTNLLYLSCISNVDDSQFAINLLAKSIENGNPFSDFIAQLLKEFHNKSYKDMAKAINLEEILINGEISQLTFINMPKRFAKFISPELVIDYLKQDKIDYLSNLSVIYDFKRAGGGFLKLLFTKVQEFLFLIDSEDNNIIPCHYYGYEKLLSQFAGDEIAEALLIQLKLHQIYLNDLTQQLPKEKSSANYRAVYGEKAEKIYYENRLWKPNFEEKVQLVQNLIENE